MKVEFWRSKDSLSSSEISCEPIVRRFLATWKASKDPTGLYLKSKGYFICFKRFLANVKLICLSIYKVINFWYVFSKIYWSSEPIFVKSKSARHYLAFKIYSLKSLSSASFFVLAFKSAYSLRAYYSSSNFCSFKNFSRCTRAFTSNFC